MPRDTLNTSKAAKGVQNRRLAHTAAVMRRPRCKACGQIITTEMYTRLAGALYCECCIKANTHYADELEG